MVGKFIDKLDNSQHPRRVIFVFLFIWLIVNLIQSAFTELANDEAYYWMYSKYLDWGYFDHPPMIALMIRSGYSIFHNELGVRFLVVLCQIAALIIIWSLTDEEHKRKEGNTVLFIMLIIILPVFNMFGFIATPDAPLILFSAVFLLAYKKYLDNESWRNILFLGFSMSALVYSKYHGILLILLVILSNLRLFKKQGFYMASLLALI